MVYDFMRSVKLIWGAGGGSNDDFPPRLGSSSRSAYICGFVEKASPGYHQTSTASLWDLKGGVCSSWVIWVFQINILKACSRRGWFGLSVFGCRDLYGHWICGASMEKVDSDENLIRKKTNKKLFDFLHMNVYKLFLTSFFLKYKYQSTAKFFF